MVNQKLLDAADNLDELFQIHGFRNEAIRMEAALRAEDVLLGPGTS